ncbi:MAG: response regulator [Anaerolineales bacterium]
MKNPKKPAVILVVDDTIANLQVLVTMLDGQGYRTRPVDSGALALRAARSSPPDLILLDIMMPGMDGFEVCRRLKTDEQTRDVPVIFISALDAIEDKVRGFAAGGVDYVTKPFQVEEVLARVETHLALRNLQKRLQLQVAELDAFAHTVAHDLKGPLSVIIGYASILEDTFGAIPKDEFDQYLYAISQTSIKMSNIIDELLLLAEMREKKVEIHPLDMVSITTEAQKRLIYLFEQYQVEIMLPEAWPEALGYGPWVEEVWVNYISNAIKYGGRPPCVELGADVGKTDDLPYNTARFWVRDNGPGLSSEERARLFTPFERFHQARARGHGLGLSIVRRIVEKLGGQVGVESDGAPGAGSIFWFTLPV